MNIISIKAAIILSLIFGAVLGIVSTIPIFLGLCCFILLFLSAILIIIYMKKDKKYLDKIDVKDGGIIGAFIGFFATVGFFITFSPLVCIIKFIFKNYYTFIPELLKDMLWLFLILVFMAAITSAAINAAGAMGVSWLYQYIEQKEDNSKIEKNIEKTQNFEEEIEALEEIEEKNE